LEPFSQLKCLLYLLQKNYNCPIIWHVDLEHVNYDNLSYQHVTISTCLTTSSKPYCSIYFSMSSWLDYTYWLVLLPICLNLCWYWKCFSLTICSPMIMLMWTTSSFFRIVIETCNDTTKGTCECELKLVNMNKSFWNILLTYI